MRAARGRSAPGARCRWSRRSLPRRRPLEAHAPKRPSDVLAPLPPRGAGVAEATSTRPAGTGLVDAHCHLGDRAFDPDREAVLDRARDAGVSHVVVIGATLAESDRAVALARIRPGLSATAGVHPHEARSWSAEAAARLRGLLALPEVVALGETGLDYHYDHSPRDDQRRAFEAQLRLAAEAGKPGVVHARGADVDMAAMLVDADVVGVLHSLSSGYTVFHAGIGIDEYLWLSGMSIS